MNEQQSSKTAIGSIAARSPYGYNELNTHNETTEIGEFTDTLNSDRVKLESSFFDVKHQWQTDGKPQADARRTTTDINNYGISIVTLTKDNEVLIYHDGRVYKPVNTYWIDNIADDLRAGRLPAHLPGALCLADVTTHPLGAYITANWTTLSTGYNIITYCRCQQLGKVAGIISRYPFAFRNYRVTRQQHLTAYGVHRADGETTLAYNGMYCHYNYADGMTEIISSGMFDELPGGSGMPGGGNVAETDNSTAFFCFVAGAMRLLFCKPCTTLPFHVGDVLLDALPIGIGVCKASPGSPIRTTDRMVEPFTILPLKKSADLTLAESDELYAGPDDCLRPLDARRRFGYQPRHVRLTMDADHRSWLTIRLDDTDNGRSVTADFIYLREHEHDI